MSKESIKKLETVVESIEKDFSENKTFNMKITIDSTLMSINLANQNEGNIIYKKDLIDLKVRLDNILKQL